MQREPVGEEEAMQGRKVEVFQYKEKAEESFQFRYWWLDREQTKATLVLLHSFARLPSTEAQSLYQTSLTAPGGLRLSALS